MATPFIPGLLLRFAEAESVTDEKLSGREKQNHKT